MPGYDPLGQQQRSMALDQMNRVRAASSRELDAQKTRQDSEDVLNAGAGMFLGGGWNEAPSSGYSDAAGYAQGLADKRTLAEAQGGPLNYRSSYGGTDFGSRPSLTALRGGGDLGGYQDGDNARINSREVAPTFEQRREGATIAGQDARVGAELNDERAANSAAFDLGSGRAMQRSKDIGAIQDEAKMGDARLNSNIYFDPAVKKQREDEFYNRMEEIRQRYADPAIIKGQAAIAEANARGAYGLQRQESTNAGNLAVQGSRNDASRYGADTRARASVGAATAAAGGKGAENFVPPAPTAPAGKTMSLDDLQGFARDNGMSIGDAHALAQQHGYTVQ